MGKYSLDIKAIMQHWRICVASLCCQKIFWSFFTGESISWIELSCSASKELERPFSVGIVKRNACNWFHCKYCKKYVKLNKKCSGHRTHLCHVTQIWQNKIFCWQSHFFGKFNDKHIFFASWWLYFVVISN